MNPQLNTAEALIADVKLRCEIKVTPENLLAKMRSMKTKGSNEVFQQELETLSNKLKASYLEQMIPEPVAARMATKAGVDTLINQASSLEEKLILKTGSFSSIQEAIQKVNECVQTNENRQVLHFNKNGNHTNNRWRNVPTRNNRGNHVRQNNRGRSQNFYPQQNQRTFYRPNSNRGNFGNNGRNNYRQNNSRYPHNHQRVYYADGNVQQNTQPLNQQPTNFQQAGVQQQTSCQHLQQTSPVAAVQLAPQR